MTEAEARAAGLTEAEIAALHLDEGSHKSPEQGHCLLEVVSMLAGEKFGDSPRCVDPVLAAFGRSWNDRLPDDERQSLKQYIPLLAGTYQGPKLQVRRAFMALDWLWRVNAPMWLEHVPELAEHAAALRALAPITAELGEAERTAAIDQANEAAWAAMAARAARAAWDAWAAWDAAAAAAQTAAFEAAKGCATYEEARAKADAVFMAHRDEVQAQLHDLYTRMINAELQDSGTLDQVGSAAE